MLHPQKIRRAGIGLTASLLLSCAWGLSACANPLQAESVAGNDRVAERHVRKVQTMPELMARLKAGLEQRRLNDPSFYEQELGYPVERPQSLTQLEPANERYRKIDFDEGELKDMRLHVEPATARPGRVDMLLSGYGTAEHCISLDQLQALWGAKPHNLPEIPTSRGSAEQWVFSYRFAQEDKVVYAVQKDTLCLVDFVIYQNLISEGQ